MAPWGRLCHNSHLQMGTETQRGDTTCHIAWKCPSWDSNSGLCDPQALPPSPFTNLSLHVPQGPSQTPRACSNPWLFSSLWVTCMPTGVGVGFWPLGLGKSLCFLLPVASRFLPSQGGRWPGLGSLSCPQGWEEA